MEAGPPVAAEAREIRAILCAEQIAMTLALEVLYPTRIAVRQ